jgi:glycosyltransferase involved in cell wall biosynthesis
MTLYLVTNICPQYRVKAFELLATLHKTRFLFFSEGQSEKYWERKNPTALGNFDGGYLKGLNIPGTRLRFVPILYKHLIFDRYDVLMNSVSGKMPLLLSFLIARLRRIPIVLWTGLWHHPQTLVHRISFPVLRFLYRQADAIVVYGSHVERYLRDMGVPKERIFIAWQAVDNEHFAKPISEAALLQLRQELGAEDRKIVLYVGRLEDQKGIEYLLKAVPEVAKRIPLTLVAIGTGSRGPAFRRMLQDSGFSQFQFVGFVASDHLPMYYRLADVLVLPSVTTRDFREPWGLVINEAMNQGCPVIATNAVGAAVGGLVKEGVTGLVVPERDSDAIAEALHTILGNDAIRLQMGANASEEIKRWSYGRMVSGFNEAVTYASSHRMGGR